jgi:Putative DNA-binding domain
VSIYSAPISQLKASDLTELLQEQAVENTRLEFKREVPDKDETLKKLSSFANTFGGFVVVGAGARSKDGRIEDLRGVAEVPGYKQKIVDWCFKECSPPITVDVSNPIPTTDNSGKVCYVISVEESDVAPHFLNGRKGVWIRTNEFSGRFDAALANENELQQLLRRRQLVMERRHSILERARKRFEIYLSTLSTELSDPNASGAVFELCLVPRFPARQICKQEEIAKLLQKVRYPTYRDVGFPRYEKPMMTQYESAIIRQPLDMASLLEANVWGMVFYATRLDEVDYPGHRGNPLTGIHLYEFVGHLILFLRHANDLFRLTGLMGSILIEASLRSIRDRRWVYAREVARGMSPMGTTRPSSGLDDEFTLSVPTTVELLREQSDEVAMEIVRSIFFSLDWGELVDGQAKVEALLEQGHYFNKG